MASRFFAQVDKTLMFCVVSLVGLGLYNLSSASQPMGVALHWTQATYMVIGILLSAAIVTVHYRHFEDLAYPVFALAVALLFATEIFGKVVNGSQRWLSLGFVAVQTSDIVKLAVVVVVAKLFHTERWETGMTLQQIFRPMNISRPALMLVLVLVLAVFGDKVAAPKLQVPAGGHRYRAVLKLKAENLPVVVGRSVSTPNLRVDVGGVAPNHVEITRVGGGQYRLRDLAPSEGTFVNDERVEGEVVLKHGDIIRLGVSNRAQYRFKHSLGPIRWALPWIALAGVIWLIASVFLQLKKRNSSIQDLLAPIDFVAIPALFVLIQPDLGTTLIIILVAFSIILYAGIKPISLVILGSLATVSSVLAWFTVLQAYQKERVLTFINPNFDLAGAGYHQHQSVIAIGSGEFFGKGYGQGTQTQLSFLPEQQTDFIFSVWSEEHGFLGSCIVVVLFALLVLTALRIANQARDRFGALLAVGAGAIVFWHASINMLMVLRLAPVVGVPLPLWSNGGSFSVTVLMAIALIVNVSMRRNLF